MRHNDLLMITQKHVTALRKAAIAHPSRSVPSNCILRASRRSSATARDRFVFSTFNVAQFDEGEQTRLEDTVDIRSLFGENVPLVDDQIKWMLYVYDRGDTTLLDVIKITQRFDEKGDVV